MSFTMMTLLDSGLSEPLYSTTTLLVQVDEDHIVIILFWNGFRDGL